MIHATMDALQREWEILHGDHERYERLALGIKLTAVVLSLACLALGVDAIPAMLFMLVLWLQEGIWKTFQARTGARILSIEKLMQTPNRDEGAAFQLYTTWETSKRGAVDLIQEYFSNALRPTVAYPYAVLTLLLLLFSVSEA